MTIFKELTDKFLELLLCLGPVLSDKDTQPHSSLLSPEVTIWGRGGMAELNTITVKAVSSAYPFKVLWNERGEPQTSGGSQRTLTLKNHKNT